MMRLEDLNTVDGAAAEQGFLRCCGSWRWAHGMAASRPWPSVEAMADAADAIWRGLATGDHLEAFAAHPRIGAAAGAGRPASDSWSSDEQSRVATAREDVRERLAAANDEYYARFGFIFIVCATGKSADEMLAIVDARLTHSREEELQIAAEEQRKITRLRLEKLVSE